MIFQIETVTLFLSVGILKSVVSEFFFYEPELNGIMTAVSNSFN